jgi:N-methylhydantoinase B
MSPTEPHHADIGGSTPGSMGAATEIYQEGVRIPPVRLVRNGRVQDDLAQPASRRMFAVAKRGRETSPPSLGQFASVRRGCSKLWDVTVALRLTVTLGTSSSIVNG